MTEPPVRPLTSYSNHSDDAVSRALGVVVPLLAVIAAVLVLWWPSPAEEAPVEPRLVEPAVTIAAPLTPIAPAVESFESFVSAVNQGDTVGTIQLLTPELPAVAGLGTFSYPLAENDPGLWAAGELDIVKVAGFVAEPAGLPGPMAVSNCSAFGDGPAVTIVACDYAAGGVTAFPSFRPQLGKVFGFIVDATVAGVAHRIGANDAGPTP